MRPSARPGASRTPSLDPKPGFPSWCARQDAEAQPGQPVTARALAAHAVHMRGLGCSPWRFRTEFRPRAAHRAVPVRRRPNSLGCAELPAAERSLGPPAVLLPAQPRKPGAAWRPSRAARSTGTAAEQRGLEALGRCVPAPRCPDESPGRACAPPAAQCPGKVGMLSQLSWKLSHRLTRIFFFLMSPFPLGTLKPDSCRML